MKRKSLNLGVSRSADDIDKVISKLDVQMSSEEEAALKGKEKAVEIEKARVTYYLSTNTLSDLEDTYDELRRKLPYNEKSKVKKSHIVEMALELIIEDYRKKGDKSSLVKHFIK
jgi:hypothetical protein